MNPNVTAETIALTKQALAAGQTDLAKNILIATGLTAYDLQAPAKNLYPVITPLRNAIPRNGRANPGDAVRWRPILSITGSGYNSMGWIPEGQRSGSMSYSTTTQTAPYVTMGEEDTITFEAEAAGQGFEDINATASLRVLQKLMLKEELGILGGNSGASSGGISLGTPTAPTLSASGSGATFPAITASVIVVALTVEGWNNAGLTAAGTVASGFALPTTKTITGNDGNNYTLNGGVSNRSSNTTQSVSSGQTLYASTPVIQGAVAYAWFVGTAGNETLQQVTTINSASFSIALVTGTQAASSVAADYSANPGLAYNGLMTIAANASNNAYFSSLATGTSGTGSYLTASGRGSINEIDTMLLSLWNSYRLSPTVIYVNGQEQKNITTKVLSNSSGPLLHYFNNVGGQQPYDGLHASGSVRWYYNPFAVDGGQDIPIRVHPNLAPGTLMAFCEKLPAWYQQTNIESPFTIHTRRDYYRIDWPLRTRRREFGVYAEEVLVPYAPFACGLITNIGNG